MGELNLSVSIPIEGESQSLVVTARLCENPNCERSNGNRRYFVPIQNKHKFCCNECKDSWNNKTRPLTRLIP